MGEPMSKGGLDRRQDIVEAATGLFGARGYGNTTTDQIAAAANVTKRTMYRYARSKEQILRLIHQQFLDAADAVSDDWAVGAAEDRLRRFVEAFITVLVDNQDAVRIFYEELKNLSEESRAAVVHRRDVFERRLRSLIDEGMSRREFRSIDTPVAAAAILGGLADSYRWYKPTGAADPREISATAADLLLTGLAGSTGSGLAGPSTAHIGLKQTLAEINDMAPPARSLPPAVLRAAVELFVKNGYLATSTREIAARAGITKSALFYHIGSKEELLFALQDGFGRRSLALVTDHLGDLENPHQLRAKLRDLIVAHCGIVDAEHQAVELFTDQFRYLEGDHRDRIVRMRDLYTSALQHTIEYGIEAKTLGTRNPKVATLVLIGMLNSMYRWYRPGGRLSAAEVGETYATLIMDGLRRPS